MVPFVNIRPNGRHGGVIAPHRLVQVGLFQNGRIRLYGNRGLSRLCCWSGSSRGSGSCSGSRKSLVRRGTLLFLGLGFLLGRCVDFVHKWRDGGGGACPINLRTLLSCRLSNFLIGKPNEITEAIGADMTYLIFIYKHSMTTQFLASFYVPTDFSTLELHKV